MDYIARLEESLKFKLPGDIAHQELTNFKGIASQAELRKTLKPRLSAVAILIYPKANLGLHSVLIQRPKYNGAHSGQIALPGGKKEPEDPSLAHTALREMHEEIGVLADQAHILGSMSDVFVSVSKFVIKPYIVVIDKSPQFVLDPREVGGVIEYPLHELIHDPGFLERSVTVDYPRLRLKVPSFEIQSNVVWGATAMILNEFKSMLEH